ncbi:MAG TPA: 2-oxoacid:ferredoxin oxidoreductase subunit beta [Dehalococcoidia bacterium]|nr:2-oxoacid:ferredoxin oxidoreductase subunit beta [Dehalococcoidia bacterium]
MVTTNGNPAITLTRKDFVSDEEVRWCPGCGDYSILAQTQRVMPELGIPREDIVFISGIGCSSRLPYYMNTYGFHSIHGRAPTIATGLKVTRPELSVWVITGDGDALSIGGNHILHVMRRNVDLQIVLHNNEIYGLTKGQYSPTSRLGQRTKSSPMGAIDMPLNPLSVAIGAEGTFVARSIDTDTTHLQSTHLRAYQHHGASFVEVYQNCNIFNDGAFADFAAKEVRADRTLQLEHGKPMVFGKERNKGVRLNGLQPEIIDLGGPDGYNEGDCLIHDEASEDPTIHFMLSRMHYPSHPVPVGVIRAVKRATYDELMAKQIDDAIAREGEGDLQDLFSQGDVWTVEA